MEADAQRALRRLPDQDRGLTAYLRSCDRRLELLASAVAALYERDRPLQPQPVSLSEGGMAVTLPGDWSPGDTLALQITFPDDYLCLCTHATIVGLPELPDTGHSVRFDRMDDQERALLARHILQRQSQERRQAQLSGD
jgi:c-di-GMP-binding flagellar brake protein YcgR